MKKLSTMLLLAFVMAVAGCAGNSAVKPGDNDGTATARGADNEGALSGEQLTDSSGRPFVMRVHFEFDSASIDDDNRETLEAHAAYIIANGDLTIKLEGHCDERGTREYNLALGERRAKAVARFLAVLGVDRSRLRTTSYGEEKPIDEDHDGSAWERNRRVEIIY